jgi:hypothetical protein
LLDLATLTKDFDVNKILKSASYTTQYLDMLALFEMQTRLCHSLAKHVIHKQSIESLFTPFLKFVIFKSMTLEEVGSMTNTYFGTMKPKLLLGLQIGELT